MTVYEGALRMGRSRAEKLMRDRCTVKRDTGEKTQDPVTYEEVPVYDIIHTDLKCKIQSAGNRSLVVQVPGQAVVKSSMEWHVPMSTVGVLTNDLVTIDSVDPKTGDMDMIGKTLRVEGPFLKSDATARRFSVEVAS